MADAFPTAIAGYRAERLRFDLATGREPASIGVEMYAATDLENMIDSRALLRGDAGTEPPYWALVWIGARAIAQRVAATAGMRDATVLDIGCGLGLSGLAAAACGARVVFADYAPQCLAFVEASLRRNGFKNAEVRHCDFTRDRLGKRFDWVLAADVVYDPGSYERLVTFLDDHTAERGTLLLTESLRADARKVVAALCERGFGDEKEALWIEENGKPERTWLHTMRRLRRTS